MPVLNTCISFSFIFLYLQNWKVIRQQHELIIDTIYKWNNKNSTIQWVCARWYHRYMNFYEAILLLWLEFFFPIRTLCQMRIICEMWVCIPSCMSTNYPEKIIVCHYGIGLQPAVGSNSGRAEGRGPPFDRTNIVAILLIFIFVWSEKTVNEHEK